MEPTMTSESLGFDPYEAVLTDLRAKRDQLDQTIKLLEAQRSGSAVSPGVTANQAAPEGPGAYLGMTIADAAKRLLMSRKQPLGNAEILAGLKAGGLVMQGATPINTLGSVLFRRFHDVGDIVRIGRGTWGLAEWYPNRNFKKKAKGEGEGGETETNETNEPESPLKPTLVAARG
jgi:HB1, ASXL, restriction endonuclease HTH domain